MLRFWPGHPTLRWTKPARGDAHWRPGFARGGTASKRLAAAAAKDGAVAGGSSFGRAKSCIVLFLMGGPPQHSTWDPKPDAPADIRGDFRPIATTVPGLSISELFPRTALVADKVCILRAMSTGDNAHSSSGYYMLTGRPHQPMNFENANPGAPNDAPSLGALVCRLGDAHAGMPRAVTSRTGFSTRTVASGRARMPDFSGEHPTHGCSMPD